MCVYGGGNMTVTFCDITSQIWQPDHGKRRSASTEDAHNIFSLPWKHIMPSTNIIVTYR